MRAQVAGAVLAMLLSASAAGAHRPDFGDGDYANPDTAYVIEDPGASIVVYREVTCERPELWMRLVGQAGMPLYVQLLVPAIDRLSGYRPTLAVVGPGLPRTRVGIDVPAGAGAVAFQTDTVEPVVFDERFTGTRDWILVEETLILPQTGTYYVVAWDPGRSTGKLAVAVGTREVFGLLDLFRFPGWRRDARAFHEMGPATPGERYIERICPN